MVSCVFFGISFRGRTVFSPQTHKTQPEVEICTFIIISRPLSVNTFYKFQWFCAYCVWLAPDTFRRKPEQRLSKRPSVCRICSAPALQWGSMPSARGCSRTGMGFLPPLRFCHDWFIRGVVDLLAVDHIFYRHGSAPLIYKESFSFFSRFFRYCAGLTPYSFLNTRLK